MQLSQLGAAELVAQEVADDIVYSDGSLIAADEETIAGGGEVQVSPLVSMLGLPPDAAIEVFACLAVYNQRTGKCTGSIRVRFSSHCAVRSGRRGAKP